MSLPRILEPEVMDSDEEARNYDAMDHASVNAAFCADLLVLTNALDPLLDVVAQYASNTTLQRRALLEASLRASFRLDEVRAFAQTCGVPASAVQQTSGRHWTLVHVVGSEQA